MELVAHETEVAYVRLEKARRVAEGIGCGELADGRVERAGDVIIGGGGAGVRKDVVARPVLPVSSRRCRGKALADASKKRKASARRRGGTEARKKVSSGCGSACPCPSEIPL
jgi:hypothetical protein